MQITPERDLPFAREMLTRLGYQALQALPCGKERDELLTDTLAAISAVAKAERKTLIVAVEG